MNLKTRRFIFYSFLFLFIVAGLGVIFYSQGWRINTENCQIVKLLNCQIKLQKTGGVFIETKPKGVVIKIDGKIFQDKSGLIQSGTLISNLLPKNYKIEIEKDGYLSWNKNFLVKSGLVTELFKIVLIPEKLEKKPISISKTIDNFWINPQQKILFNNKDAVYYLQDSSVNVKLRGDKLIQWSDDGDKMILQDSKNQIYYLYEFNNLSKTLNVSAVLNNLREMIVSDIIFYPIESNRLIIKNKDGLYLLDLNRFKLENLITEPPKNVQSLPGRQAGKSILAWTIKNPDIYYISRTLKSLSLIDFNLISKMSDTLIDLPVSSSVISEMSVSGSKIAFLTEDGSLYFFNRENKDFKQIAYSAKKFIFSDDGEKIAFLDKDEKINVYFLEDYKKGINKKAGETIEINLFKESGLTVKNIFWYKDSFHLLIDYITPDKIEKIDFVEIDNRLPINKYTLAANASNFDYETNLNRLYFIQKNNLYFIEI